MKTECTCKDPNQGDRSALLADFFEKNSIDPEHVALELEFLKDCLVLGPDPELKLQDIRQAYLLLSELASMFRSM